MLLTGPPILLRLARWAIEQRGGELPTHLLPSAFRSNTDQTIGVSLAGAVLVLIVVVSVWTFIMRNPTRADNMLY